MKQDICTRVYSICQGPIAYTRYAQIEKELLSVLFALERFNSYTYGAKVLVENDHKPLEIILKKSLHDAPPRLQRMLLRLQKYDFVIKHKPGKDLVVADTLSRAPLPDTDPEIEKEIYCYVHTLLSTLPATDEMMARLKRATSEDESLQKIKKIKKIHERLEFQSRDDKSLSSTSEWTSRDRSRLSRIY